MMGPPASPREVPFFFPGDRGRLFGVFHGGGAAAGGRGFVFCHPFAEEKLWAHRVWVAFARELAARGHSVLRFDFAGNGDSDGEFAESSVRTGVSDIAHAIEVLKERNGIRKVGLLGLRFGATLAALAAEERKDISELVLWQPVLSGERYLRELLLVNVATQMAVYKEVRANRAALSRGMREGRTANVDGYEISQAMYEELSSVNLGENRMRFGGRCLVARITRALESRPAEDLDAFVHAYQNASGVEAQEEPFWKEIPQFYQSAPSLFVTTVAWLEGA